MFLLEMWLLKGCARRIDVSFLVILDQRALSNNDLRVQICWGLGWLMILGVDQSSRYSRSESIAHPVSSGIIGERLPLTSGLLC
jgi:hypothetical protein